MKCFVTGAAGFIGSHLVDRLLADGHTVTGYDNLSTGRRRNLKAALAHPAFTFCQASLLPVWDHPELAEAVRGHDMVFHLAANADVRRGPEDPDRDLSQNTLATYALLEAMRAAGVRQILFTSTGAIYGETPVVPTPEDAPFPIQTSLYGASKLACEGLLEAYSSSFDFQVWIVRLVSVLGARYHHGHVIDFYRQLQAHPDYLTVLGDGSQAKSYVSVGDTVSGLLCALKGSHDPVNRFNIGRDEMITVNESVAAITRYLGLSPRVITGHTPRGWIGDNPHLLLDCRRLRSLGWESHTSIRAALALTLDDLKARQE